MVEPVFFGAIATWLLVGLIVEGLACLEQWRHLAAQAEGWAGASTAIRYGQRRALFQWLSAVEKTVRVALWLVSGALVFLYDTFFPGAGVPVVSVLLHVTGFVVAFALCDQLLREVVLIGRWYWVERACGMSIMAWPAVLADTLRRLLTQAVIALAAACALVWPLMIVGWPWQWLLSGVLLLAGSAVLYWVRPQLIEPLFHRFTVLAPGELRERLNAMMHRCGAELDNVLVMDTSRRSRLANAHFAGLGRRKRVVLSDTLIERLSPAELEAVVAHELGHFRCGHLHRYYGLQAVMLLSGYVVFGLLQSTMAPETTPAVWALSAYLLLPALAWPMKPVFAYMRRQYEYEADAFAARYAQRSALISALKQLLSANLGAATMATNYARYYATHPPGDIRLERLQN